MMKRKSIKCFCALLLTVALMCGFVPLTVLAADYDTPPANDTDVTYYKEDGTSDVVEAGTYTVLTPDTTNLTTGWYVAKSGWQGFRPLARVEISGDVKIIIENYASFYISYGIHVSYGNSLTMYASNPGSAYISLDFGSGTPVSNLSSKTAIIGGNAGETNGTIKFVNICFYQATAPADAPVIGTGGAMGDGYIDLPSDPQPISFYGGSMVLNGGSRAAALGGGYHASSSPIYLYNMDQMVAYGHDGGAGIGGGLGGCCSKIVVDIQGNVVSESFGLDGNTSTGSGAGIGDGENATHTFSSSDPIISIRRGGVVSISGQGNSFLLGKNAGNTNVPENAVSVYASASVRILEKGGSNADAHFTKDMTETWKFPGIELYACRHDHAHYEVEDGRHLFVCEECRTPFDYEVHDFNDDLICKDCGYGASVVLHSVATVLTGKIQFRYTLSLSDEMKADPNAYLCFTDYDTGAEVKRIKVSELKPAADGSGRYYAFLPKCIVDFRESTNLKVYRSNGQLASLYSARGINLTDSGFNYSLDSYAISTTAYHDQAMVDVAYGIRHYGIGSRRIMGEYEYENVVSEIMDSVSLEDLAPYKATTSQNKSEVAGLKNSTIRLKLDSDNTLRVTFYLNEGENVSDYKFYLGAEGGTASEVPPVSLGSNAYAVDVKALSVRELGDKYTFSIQRDGKTYSVTACALSYAYTSAKSGDPNKIQFGKALYNYYEKANYYLNTTGNE